MRYILGEWLPIHFRPLEADAEEAAIAARTALGDDAALRGLDATPPVFDPDSFLDGAVRRVFKAGRFDVLEVSRGASRRGLLEGRVGRPPP